tara:strand:- start:12 stop:200 length:189 start_codon:yes stop_codon:yes gene_type:complete
LRDQKKASLHSDLLGFERAVAEMFDAETAWIHIAEIIGDPCVRSQDAANSVVTYGMGRNIEA